MQIKTNSKNKKIILIITSIVFGFLLAVIFLYATTGSFFGINPLNTNSSIGEKPPTKDQINTGKSIKDKSVSGKESSSGSDKPVSPVPAVDEGRTTEVDIISISPIESIVRVSVMISYLDQSGVCDISITNDKDTSIYTASVGTQAQSNTSVCKGFDVPASVFTPGKYKVFINYRSGDVSGSAEQNYVSN